MNTKPKKCRNNLFKTQKSTQIIWDVNLDSQFSGLKGEITTKRKKGKYWNDVGEDYLVWGGKKKGTRFGGTNMPHLR